jgi:DNA replication and repair protein RecF
MKLQKLQLENFRSYTKYEHTFNHDTTILVGENGLGKTNFLEAIYLLSLGRSFRTSTPEDLINWGQPHLRCLAEVEVDDDKLELQVFYSKTPKRKNFKINDVNKRNSDYIGNFLTVLFHPEDLNMLYLNPSYRRQYLNILLSQTDRAYLLALSSYKKVMKQRNALLHKIRDQKFTGADITNLLHDLDTWDAQLIQFGTDIIQKRQALIHFLTDRLPKLYQAISGRNENVHLEYQAKKLDDLALRRDREIMQAQTTLGPHRDDLTFFIANHEISASASRGEFRTLLLAIKLAEIAYIQEKTGENPVLLLDDVFSELDPSRQKHLLEAIKTCQTIITTTSDHEFPKTGVDLIEM